MGTFGSFNVPFERRGRELERVHTMHAMDLGTSIGVGEYLISLHPRWGEFCAVLRAAPAMCCRLLRLHPP